MKGEFAAVGAAGEGGYGLPVPRPVVVVCDAAGRCASRVLTLGAVRGAAHMQDAVALSDDGTVTVLAAYCPVRHMPQQPCGRPLGLWATLRRPDRHWLAPRELSRAAAMQPLGARADGPRRALVVFADEHGGKTGVDLSRLPVGSDRFTKPLALGGPAPSEDVALAANTAGKFVLAWRTAASTSRMTVMIGEAGHLGARLRTPHSEDPLQIQAGIDGSGDAIVI